MRGSSPPPIGRLLLAVAALALGGPAVQAWLVRAGRCTPRGQSRFVPSRYGGADSCFLFKDDRWEALVAAAIAVGALVALRRLHAAARADGDGDTAAAVRRARAARFLRAVAVVALALAFWLGVSARGA